MVPQDLCIGTTCVKWCFPKISVCLLWQTVEGGERAKDFLQSISPFDLTTLSSIKYFSASVTRKSFQSILSGAELMSLYEHGAEMLFLPPGFIEEEERGEGDMLFHKY